jgi:hypothetical protein
LVVNNKGKQAREEVVAHLNMSQSVLEGTGENNGKPLTAAVCVWIF